MPRMSTQVGELKTHHGTSRCSEMQLRGAKKTTGDSRSLPRLTLPKGPTIVANRPVRGVGGMTGVRVARGQLAWLRGSPVRPDSCRGERGRATADDGHVGTRIHKRDGRRALRYAEIPVFQSC